MKKLILLLIIGLMSCNSTYKKLHHSFHFIKQDKEQFEISAYEVTNAQYRTFAKETQISDFLPDTTMWNDLNDGIGIIHGKNYYWHQAFDDYPVVNITPFQAKAYCDWLTQKSKRQGNKSYVEYRLPTSDELISIITSHNIIEKRDYINQYSCDFTGNFKYKIGQTDTFDYNNDKYLLCGNITAYKQGDYYNLIGNVAEICSDGYVIGGGWNDIPSQSLQKRPFTNASPDIGFRIVAEQKQQ
ncbi:MAG: SUMF1/EgtB/PvdO family nonheme iron enzyme [Saprospiraceae bacterium]|nr:SUMF1/EgtB/PvdO family nonheme iron enzyme [Saprospiraceae bacterium]